MDLLKAYFVQSERFICCLHVGGGGGICASQSFRGACRSAKESRYWLLFTTGEPPVSDTRESEVNWLLSVTTDGPLAIPGDNGLYCAFSVSTVALGQSSFIPV